MYEMYEMDEQIVVIGGGPAGTLAANRLRAALGDTGHRIVVIDRTDPRDQELELLVALGVYGPATLQPPEHLRLREGIGFRLANAAAVDTDRQEVCLTDGTTIPYGVLVLATGRHPVPATTGGPQLAVVAGSLPATSRADVFAVTPVTAATWEATERPISSQVERLVSGVRRYLDRRAPAESGVARTSAG
ncbi:FAD-dependent oxidoreductase [Streptomyces sp. NBC_01190]|uniref:FAD-dependent oxidoreductase n=1 Tax=Streptomyces sp. NBC_01190 TaxID=2903767 RepID=UPI0038665FAD|nr:FAD-dependent oxidoreductase [Streptomyces sp. NBC_01190]